MSGTHILGGSIDMMVALESRWLSGNNPGWLICIDNNIDCSGLCTWIA